MPILQGCLWSKNLTSYLQRKFLEPVQQLTMPLNTVMLTYIAK